MTVDAPAAAAHPLRFVQPLIAGLASVGVVTLAARPLFGIQPIAPDMAETTVVIWLTPIVAVLMLAAPVAAVAMHPPLGTAGGWPIVAAGMGVSTLVVQTILIGVRGEADLAWTLVVVAGYAAALGGVMLAVAQAPFAEGVAISAGVAFGLAGQRFSLDLLVLEQIGPFVSRTMPLYLVIGLAVVAAMLAFTRAHRDARQDGSPAIVPVVVVVAVASAVQVGHWVRRAVVEEFRVSPDGLASQRREDAVAAFSEYSAIALAAGAGLILMWLAYRRGKADMARWVVLGFALGGPSLLMLFGYFYGRTADVMPLFVTALLFTAAGVGLALFADRLFAWDALGVVVVAVGVIIVSVSYRLGASALEVANLLIAAGFALAMASGLTRTVRAAKSGAASAAQVGLSLVLGVATLLITAVAVAPAAWLMVAARGFEGFKLSLPITSLVAAVVLVLLFGFHRAVDRVRRELQEQAAQPPSA